MDWENFRLSKRLILSESLNETLYKSLLSIDTVKNTFSLAGHLLPQTINRLTKSAIVTSTGASNRIEGNRLTDVEVEAIFRGMRIKSFKSRDEQEVAGYLEVLQRIFEDHQAIPFRESVILQIHQDMLTYSEKDQRHKGLYKFGSNRVEAKDHEGNVVGIVFDPTPPYLVAKEMKELLDWYKWASESQYKHPLILIANFIFEYLAIHPFQDGNGRTSRLLTNLLLLHNGYGFARFISHEKLIEESKAEYYIALNKTQQTWKSEHEDMQPWLSFILGIFEQQARQARALLEQDHVEYLLSESQLKVLQWAKEQESFSRKDVVLAFGFPPRTAEAIIKKLYDLKRIEKFGQGRATRYRTHD
jgi:Fic family protein